MKTTINRLQRIEAVLAIADDVMLVVQLPDGGLLVDGVRYESLADLPPAKVKFIMPEKYPSPEAWAKAMADGTDRTGIDMAGI
jgi:hypothetical protein